MDAIEAEKTALDLVMAELGLQNRMWGDASERSDIQNGQLLSAGHAQIQATLDRRERKVDAFHIAPRSFPRDWSGFRSYGGDIPNVVVGITFAIQEVKRLLMNGEDPTRLARQPDQKYDEATGLPNTIEE